MGKSRVQKEKAKHRTNILKKFARFNEWHGVTRKKRRQESDSNFAELARRLGMTDLL